tara:strand:- start:198 stop:434 length:237 start_codon:yes stop_codon:yes gene_type:complete
MNANLIFNALIKGAEAKEAKAVANLQNYMSNSAGIGEHPDIIEECSKLVKEIAEAHETVETIQKLIANGNQQEQQPNK